MDFKLYEQFVDTVTSQTSKDTETLVTRLREIEEKFGINGPRFLTAGLGLADESGEIAGLVKKCVYHGKDITDEVRHHLLLELSDVLWYFTQMLITLGITLEDVVNANIRKLEARYPGGVFSAWHSENRQPGDL